jgi:tellurite resistance protein TehA-like permease
MIIVTIILCIVGVIIAFGNYFVQTRHLIKSGNPELKILRNYIKLAVWSALVAVLFLLNLKLALAYRMNILVESVFVAGAFACFYIMYQVFDLIDKVVFRNQGDALESGRASRLNQIAAKNHWL